MNVYAFVDSAAFPYAFPRQVISRISAVHDEYTTDPGYMKLYHINKKKAMGEENKKFPHIRTGKYRQRGSFPGTPQ